MVTTQNVAVRAAKPTGVFYGLQTLRQLLPAASFRQAPVADVAWRAPAVQIEDQPRFAWRGNHLDVGRHYLPKEIILKHIDLMALHKLNVFRWHLTEDQGWRLEIEKYPKLTEVGAWRKDRALGPPPARGRRRAKAWKFRGKAHGGFYTQDEAREVVRYAADRFITVGPEIEMPGHAAAAIAAYPEFGNTGKPTEVATPGVSSRRSHPEERTLGFLQDVLDGSAGDLPVEVHPHRRRRGAQGRVEASAGAQARISRLGLENEAELQSWFIRQFDTWLAARGSAPGRLGGDPRGGAGARRDGDGLAEYPGGDRRSQAGHDAMMAPKACTYFDHRQSRDPREPAGIGSDANPLEKVYGFDPGPGGAAARGGQARPRGPGAALDRIHARPQTPGVRRLATAVRAGRSGLVPRRRPEAAARRLQAATPAAHLGRLDPLDVNYRPLDGPLPAAACIP